MFLNRRQFLLSIPGVIAGFILPSFFKRATEYLERTGRPLIQPPERHDTVMTAMCTDSYGYLLNLGPMCGPPQLSLREVIDRYFWGDLEDYIEDSMEDRNTVLQALDRPADPWVYVDNWYINDSSQALAYTYLKDLDLGPELENRNAVGSLDFLCHGSPGNGCIAVHATNDISLSLLQERLNQLDQGVKIELRALP